MSIFDFLTLVCGLALFLFGMNIMGDSLQRSAGSGLKTLLRRMTSNPFKGFALGVLVTAILQSSSATTVMVVGFVNSGTLTLTQSIGIIIGAELGAAVTAWLTALSGIESGANTFLECVKPSTWMPILALVGIGLVMFSKNQRKKDFGKVFLGFAVLMTGMETMSSAVVGLRTDAGFRSLLTMFNNPILGVLVGVLVTAAIQSSSASVGILQSLTTTGAVTWGMTIPIVMGQNIGTCITALLAAIGANKNGKRASIVHLYFNVIGTVVLVSVFCLLDWLSPTLAAFFAGMADMWAVAIAFTGFKFLSVLLLFPLQKWLEKLAVISIPDKDGKSSANPLDDHLFRSPAIAVERASSETADMAAISCKSLLLALGLFEKYDEKVAAQIRDWEGRVDVYEDEIGSYLVRLSALSMDEADSHEVTKLLRLIGDFERISDHAVNLVESAEEMRDKKIEFSAEAKHELQVLTAAVVEILTLTQKAFVTGDAAIAVRVEPLEEHIDDLREQIKVHHILRLRKSECTIEHGFVLSDILTNLERVADHCSNVAGCVIEIKQHDALDMHRYLDSVKQGGADFSRMYDEYRQQYTF